MLNQGVAKVCNKCGETKSLDEFHKRKGSPDGHQYACKPCTNAVSLQWQRNHPESARESQRKYQRSENYKERWKRNRARPGWKEKNRAGVQARRAAFILGEPRWVLQRHIRTRFGMELEDYDRLIISQSGRCAICEEPLKWPVVDHCHTTDAVRGLLCVACNAGLGQFYDNVKYLQGAIRYIS
jgi:hypothetical protein